MNLILKDRIFSTSRKNLPVKILLFKKLPFFWVVLFFHEVNEPCFLDPNSELLHLLGYQPIRMAVWLLNQPIRYHYIVQKYMVKLQLSEKICCRGRDTFPFYISAAWFREKRHLNHLFHKQGKFLKSQKFINFCNFCKVQIPWVPKHV